MGAVLPGCWWGIGNDGGGAAQPSVGFETGRNESDLVFVLERNISNSFGLWVARFREVKVLRGWDGWRGVGRAALCKEQDSMRR